MAFVASNPRLGIVDINTVGTQAPGTGSLPSVTLEPFLGEIVTAYNNTTGLASAAEFIYLQVPASTAIPAGTLVQWSTTGTNATPSFYVAAALPVLATSKNTNVSIGVAVAAISSSTSVQYAWFQIQGVATVLKTAVAVSPSSVIYASGTAGRLKVLTSAGGQILGARTANAATISAGVSSVLVYVDRPKMQGQIT